MQKSGVDINVELMIEYIDIKDTNLDLIADGKNIGGDINYKYDFGGGKEKFYLKILI